MLGAEVMFDRPRGSLRPRLHPPAMHKLLRSWPARNNQTARVSLAFLVQQAFEQFLIEHDMRRSGFASNDKSQQRRDRQREYPNEAITRARGHFIGPS